MRWFYILLRRIFPAKWHGLLTAFLYDLKIKPTINRKAKSPFSKGIIVLSADFEMAWAFRFSKTRGKIADQMGLRERKNVPKLLALFEKYNIPVTWATVGHLFLESCKKEPGSLAHKEMLRPSFFINRNWNFTNGDWYQHDPCSNYTESPGWYAPDLIEQIISSPTNHEVGCHTFSHIDCTDNNCTPDLFYAEINECINQANRKGIQLKSMVFPGGTYGNFPVLKNLGFSCYRMATKFDINIPTIDKYGLVQIPSSHSLDKSSYNWPAKKYIKIANSFVIKASKRKMVAHLWFHPSMDEWYLNEVLPEVLANIRKMADNGKLEILTMDQIASKTISVNINKQHV